MEAFCREFEEARAHFRRDGRAFGGPPADTSGDPDAAPFSSFIIRPPERRLICMRARSTAARASRRPGSINNGSTKTALGA